ncbi:XRE family transcriptional regulator [uncultured Planococcus sp.]|uniref:XRE family transcriptional regulator n=1 Tax=uncultured Planococcus sp. TaxID=337815 RepID=UPI00262C9C8E|nr:XRE family transcriptional regulator [uncultured Planococcus sp.]
MITYEPLKRTLLEKGWNISDLRKHGVHPTIVAAINRNELLTLMQIERICTVLDVPIEKVVQVIRAKE